MNTMKKIFILFFSLLTSVATFSQAEEALDVITSVEKISDEEYYLVFSIEIAEDWHLYSQYNPVDASQPLYITIAEGSAGFELLGKAEESETEVDYSDLWGMDETFFVDEAIIKQKIKVTDSSITQASLKFDGQICKEFCVPFKEEFTFSLTGEVIAEVTPEVDEASAEKTQELSIDLKNTELLRVATEQEVKDESKGKNLGSLIEIFFLGFIGGFIAFLTPCVFPMTPLTVSFFTKGSENRRAGIFRAFLYGFFIFLIYILLSLPFHFLDQLDPSILNNISTNVWLNLFFFIILVFFAGSFFGYYEITLPSSWGDKMDTASGIGGIIGIFFMALTLAIVSFSCTGPILGSLLASSLGSEGGAMQLSVGMGGFGLALALPFTLFALFPSMLATLPKSGGWLNTIKAFLGFFEIALALKFLSNADLVGHWGILKREVFIGLWIIIFILFAFYLFGKINFPGGRAVKKLAGVRILMGLVSLAFVVYLIGGMFKTPLWGLNALSGILPPQFHSIYKGEKDNDCPLSLNCFKDFDEGVAYAKKNNKPILLDFTGWACANCRRMEEKVWSFPKIYNMLRNDYVLISLYVDDNEKKLPPDKTFDYIRPNGKISRIRTYGDKWTAFQQVNFRALSQPYYVLMSPDLEILNVPKQRTDIKTYQEWLEQGLRRFKSLSIK